MLTTLQQPASNNSVYCYGKIQRNNMCLFLGLPLLIFTPTNSTILEAFTM